MTICVTLQGFEDLSLTDYQALVTASDIYITECFLLNLVETN